MIYESVEMSVNFCEQACCCVTCFGRVEVRDISPRNDSRIGHYDCLLSLT